MLQQTGKTIMRPLYYDFSLTDPFVVSGTKTNDYAIIHQFMLGEFPFNLNYLGRYFELTCNQARVCLLRLSENLALEQRMYIFLFFRMKLKARDLPGRIGEGLSSSRPDSLLMNFQYIGGQTRTLEQEESWSMLMHRWMKSRFSIWGPRTTF